MAATNNYLSINVKKFGLAVGLTGTILYIGCATLMAISGPAVTAAWANNILHGIDVTTILKTEMSFANMFCGIIETFILAWLTGALVASIYNYSIQKES